MTMAAPRPYKICQFFNNESQHISIVKPHPKYKVLANSAYECQGTYQKDILS